ncbi:MAG: thiamine phosphate synthase [Hydrogenophaga sp.]|uniref:thiamine phosphate synthase n=1 Tax=Hydrogenophaga sp. TaxID=1904254 RepID=UPI001E1A8E4A|nr:thiamine phosphate synthase [Hydrogenophaga sp.]MBX3608530.1 thiamine phosphate synthase [Hydrogenophaga sp.]
MAIDTLRLDATEAARRLHVAPGHTPIPMLARVLRERGVGAVVITGAQHDWLDTPHARGWLTRPRSGPTDHAQRFQQALRQGWVAADAAVLARLPDRADASDLPVLSCDEVPLEWVPPREANEDLGVYAIVDSVARVQACAQAGARLIQLRVKRPTDDPTLRDDIAEAIQSTRAQGATLVVNDHWRTALALGAPALHLGQEDWLGLAREDRDRLAVAQQQGLRLGMSSHSLWELCRARGAHADLIACGPVWPTLTKAMPWRAQGLDNLAWWVKMAGRPVVAIGGILAPEQLTQAAATGAAAGCVVRGLGSNPGQTLPAWQQAWTTGRLLPRPGAGPAPHPTLGSTPT